MRPAAASVGKQGGHGGDSWMRRGGQTNEVTRRWPHEHEHQRGKGNKTSTTLWTWSARSSVTWLAPSACITSRIRALTRDGSAIYAAHIQTHNTRTQQHSIRPDTRTHRYHPHAARFRVGHALAFKRAGDSLGQAGWGGRRGRGSRSAFAAHASTASTAIRVAQGHTRAGAKCLQA